MVAKTISFFLLFLIAGNAHAADPTLDIDKVSALTNGITQELVKRIAIGGDHRSYRSATPLGFAIGLDFGVQVTAIPLGRGFRDALSQISAGESIPAVLPLPRFSLHKGLPWGWDVGVSYLAFKENSVFGFDVQWAFVRAGSRKKVAFESTPPSVALKGSFSRSNLWFMRTTTWALDLIISKPWFIVDPYFAFGWQFAQGEIEVPDLSAVPVNVETEASFTQPRFYVGVPFNFLLFHLAIEYSYSFAQVSTYGTKLSFSF